MMTVVRPFVYPQEIEGYTSEAECRYLYEYACRVPEGGHIVELGTYKGRSAIALAQSGRQTYSFDRFKPEAIRNGHPDHMAGSFDPTEVFDHAARYGLRGNLSVVEKDSAAAAEYWRTWLDEPVDLLFIDAGHEYEQVKADFQAWEPLMAPEGVVIFDDVLWEGVQRFLLELETWEPVPGPQAGGMAAWRRVQ